MCPYNVGTPIKRVALHILGPLPVSTLGNKYIMVIIDYFTKWTKPHAIPDQEAPTMAKVVVEEFVTHLGVPQLIRSDQGRNLKFHVF